MPITNQPPPGIPVFDDNGWHQLEEAVIFIGSYGRTFIAHGRIRIRHLWTGGYYEFEPTPFVEVNFHLFPWYNKIDARKLPGNRALGIPDGDPIMVSWR
jgi:hypothetical protein